jgi:hypothetical protein
LLEKNGIGYELKDPKYFYLSFKEKQKDKNIVEAFQNYWVRSICNNMYRGKIYSCLQSYSYQIIDEKFHTSFFNPAEGIDIHQKDLTGDETLRKLEELISSCNTVLFYQVSFYGRMARYRCLIGRQVRKMNISKQY